MIDSFQQLLDSFEQLLLGFQQLLVIFSFSIFVFLLFLILKYRKSFEELAVEKPQVTRSPIFLKVVSRIHYFLVILFMIVTAYSVWFGLRPITYFAIFTLLFLTSILMVLNIPPEKKALVTRTVIFTIILLSLAQSTIPILENRLMISGPDQWRDIFATKLIIGEGSFEHAAQASGSYYSSIPLFSVLNAALTLLIGDVFLSFTVLTGIMGLVMALSIYLILLKLTKNNVASIIAVFVFLSTPRLAVDLAIPSAMSLALGSLLILMLIDYVSVPRRPTFLALLLIALATLFLHPVGIIILIALCGAFALAFFARVIKPKYPEAKITFSLLILICTMSFVYWSQNEVFNSIITPLTRLLTSVTTSLGPSIYLPRYFLSGSKIYSFAWALPVGVSAAYVLSILYWRITKKVGRAKDGETLTKFAFIAGMVGLPMLLVAFVSVIKAPGASVERYVNNITYLLLIFPTAVACSRLIGSRRKAVTFCLVALLGFSVFIGSRSPDWAPVENPSFTVSRSTYTSYYEAQTMANFLPKNPRSPVLIYDDHDISAGGVAGLANVSMANVSISYQIVRNVIDTIKDGTFEPTNRTGIIEIFVIRRDEVQNTTAIDQYMNILYDSGMHYMLKQSGAPK